MRPEAITLDEKLRLGRGATVLMLVFAFVGVAALGAGVLTAGFGLFLRAYLTSFVFFLAISLGAIYFVLVQHLTRSGWSVTVRRVAEVTGGNVLLLSVLFIPVLFGMHEIYEWTHGKEAHLSAEKLSWLDPTFFTIRVVVCFAVWIAISAFFLRTSEKQDAGGDPALSERMRKAAPVATVLYALTVTVAAFDVLMSLDPHWYSTIFPVYYFAGAVASFFAFLIVALFILRRGGRFTRSVTTEHWHDLGKQLFAYMVFWGYIAFSQYMLIWYADIPEETRWFFARQTGHPGLAGFALVIGHFALPFLVLLPRWPKRHPAVLAGIAAWLGFMGFLDCYFIVAGDFTVTHLLCFLGLGGLFAAGFTRRLARTSLVPVGDPRLPESLSFENF